MRKDLVKKVVSISVVSLVIAIVITTIVLALVPKKLANPVADGYATITVYKDGNARQYFPYENKEDDSVVSNHKEILNQIKELQRTYTVQRQGCYHHRFNKRKRNIEE